MLLRADARRSCVRTLVRPARIGGAVYCGPRWPAPSYQRVCQLATGDRPYTVSEGFCEWYANARLELASLVGVDCHSFAPRFRWQCRVGRRQELRDPQTRL